MVVEERERVARGEEGSGEEERARGAEREARVESIWQW